MNAAKHSVQANFPLHFSEPCVYKATHQNSNDLDKEVDRFGTKLATTKLQVYREYCLQGMGLDIQKPENEKVPWRAGKPREAGKHTSNYEE